MNAFRNGDFSRYIVILDMLDMILI